MVLNCTDSHTRLIKRGKVFGLYGLCKAIPMLGVKSDKTGTDDSSADATYQCRDRQFLWQLGVYYKDTVMDKFNKIVNKT